MFRARRRCTTTALVFLWTLFSLVDAQSTRAQLGRTEFPNSGKAEAQVPFLEGLLLLHSFEYEDARTSFGRARELDPDFAMAYWGEAMTHNHPLWLQEDLTAAREVLLDLGATPELRLERVPTPREKAYWQALEILYGEGEKLTRDVAYAEAMRGVMEAFPNDLDAASFYALALLGTCHEDRIPAVYMRAAAVAEEVFAKNPLHPGAAHYLIHSYDDPVHAPLGLRAAKVYAGIAPAAVHALHMPSHIFLAMGMWEEVVSSNIASFVASQQRRDRLGRSRQKHDYHSLSWLHYALLQQSRFREAKTKLDIFLADAADFPEKDTHSAAANMWATYVVATGATEVPAPEIDLAHLSTNGLATFLFAQGHLALQSGDLEVASKALEALDHGLEAGVTVETETHCATPSYAKLDTTIAQILQAELAALVALAKGDNESAVAKLERATQLEATLPIGSGPADPIKPSFELFGEVLLELGRPEAARQQFNAALARCPQRALSLAGLAAANRKLEDLPSSDAPEASR